VLFRPIRTKNELWLPEHQTLVIRESMRSVHRRNACAHGLAHAALGHVDDRPKHEHQADLFASLYLIDPQEFESVRRWAKDVPTIATELGVTSRLLEAYLRRAS
jgi:Zn-dependent peptidase ImmA (M78 family)